MLGVTPSEALFNRVLRTRVPAHITSVIVNPGHQVKAKAQMAGDHDSKRRVQPLPILTPGTVVILRDGYTDPERQWKVVEQHGQQVGVSDGQRILLRNRRLVREYQSPAQPDFGIPDMQQCLGAASLSSFRGLLKEPTMSADALPTVQEERSEPITREPSQDDIPSPPERFRPTIEQPSQDVTSPLPVESQPASSVDREGSTEPSLATSSGRPFYKEGRVTRSGREIKLTVKAKEARDPSVTVL